MEKYNLAVQSEASQCVIEVQTNDRINMCCLFLLQVNFSVWGVFVFFFQNTVKADVCPDVLLITSCLLSVMHNISVWRPYIKKMSWRGVGEWVVVCPDVHTSGTQASQMSVKLDGSQCGNDQTHRVAVYFLCSCFEFIRPVSLNTVKWINWGQVSCVSSRGCKVYLRSILLFCFIYGSTVWTRRLKCERRVGRMAIEFKGHQRHFGFT